MFNIDSFHINLAFSPVLLIIGLILAAVYTVYIYRYTIPQVSPFYRGVLVTLRALALLLILFIIFEPVITLTAVNKIPPVNLFFFDNSKSMQINDGTQRKETEEKLLHQLAGSSIRKSAELYSFGNRIGKVSFDSLDRFRYDESLTNLSRIFSSMKTAGRNISSVVIVSDGVITDGTNPVYQAEKLSIPVYTFGVGDTSGRNNVEIRRVVSNEYIYAQTPSVINAVIASSGFKNKNVTVSLIENNTTIGSQNIQLSESGLNNINLEYTPKSPGEKKLTLQVSSLPGEYTAGDNKKIFYVNVLNNKINTLIISGSPSPDLSFVRNTLQSDENLKVSTITQLNTGRFLENVNQKRLIDSADIFFLVGFPSQQTPDALLNSVLHEIRDLNKPFFLVLSSSTDFNRLRALQAELPFTIGRVNPGYTEAQPAVAAAAMDNPLLQGSTSDLNSWNNLPPVPKPNTELTAKPESNLLSKTRINNIELNSPLILSRKLGSKRSVAVLAKDIWKWKLQTAEKRLEVFDRLMLGSMRWLNTRDNQKQFSVSTSKKVYSLGEPVEFSAQVYDESFNPVDNAEVNIDVSTEGSKVTVNMNSLGGGLYEGTLTGGNPGDYQYSGTARLNGKEMGRDGGRFSIRDVEAEMISPVMDKQLMTELAKQTGGRFFYGNDFTQMLNMLEQQNAARSQDKKETKEYVLWSNEILLAAVIFLFALEWFLRKRSGMI